MYSGSMHSLCINHFSKEDKMRNSTKMSSD